MRAVNLLPEKQRPRSASGAQSGSAYVVVGLLAALLVGAAVYAITTNQVNSRKNETAALERETSQLEARAAQLAPFAAFGQLKEARLDAIGELARERIDWERLSRELSLVLPRRTWLTEVEGSTSPSTTAAPAATGAEGDVVTGPSVRIAGCAKSQPSVAALLVRLRRLNGAEDVELAESRREDATGGAAGATDSASAGEACGQNFAFEATVTLGAPGAPATGEGGEVPAALGGGP